VSESLPNYSELPVRTGAPPGSSWGLWGDNDQLGTLNLLTDARTLAAVQEVRRGSVFPLGLPLEQPQPHLVWRTNPQHHILHVGHEARGFAPSGEDDPSTGLMDRDDYLDGLWLQGSTQWDGLTHIRHPEHGNYNGFLDSDIHGGDGTKLGVDQWAARGIVGRGVLLDVGRALVELGRDYDVNSDYQITIDDLVATCQRKGTAPGVGDILLVRTGWMQSFLDSSPDRRAVLVDPATQRAPGLAAERRTVEWLWDQHVAAVASDTVGVEAAGPELRFALHKEWLPLLGMPLGEYFVLDPLAADCAADGRYTFLFVSVPLNVRGGVGTPPQAVAIK
jgi:kynurenine formamidase